MLYALGALNAFGSSYDISEVTVTIYQPRRDNVDTWQTSVADLNRWADEVVKPRATLAAAGGGEFAPGEHCRFCALAPTCRARAEKKLEVAQQEFAPPAELSDAEIGEILTLLPQLKSWAIDVEGYALARAVSQGKRWAGMKLVEGRLIRKYTDETAVAAALADAGVTDVFDRKLKTITALEKQLNKQRFNDLLADLVTKPAGKPALVPVSDTRPALEIQCAATEFSALT